MSDWQKQRKEREAIRERAHAQEFFADVSDVAPYVGINIGISPGQAGTIAIHDGNDHGTVGGVHVAVKSIGNTADGRPVLKVVIAVEVGPNTLVEMRPMIRREKWRFYDFWRWNKDKHDNELRPESEWPVLKEEK